MLLHNKKTKIVCTIGPASWDPKVMSDMIEAGMNCARVNGAFADTKELDKVRDLVRQFSDEVSLMLDIKGPEIRLNKFAEAKAIKPGDLVEIGNDDSSEIYPANYKDVYKKIEKGQRLVIGDGDVELKVTEIKGEKIMTKVVFGELLKPAKALNIPGVEITTSPLTEKDKENLTHAINTNWDFVSASFIQSAKSAREINEFIKKQQEQNNPGSGMKLIAKIEDRQGIDNIDEILKEVEGIMVARGGLGVELGLEKVPMVQKYLIDKATKAGKIVITATQMLESMTNNPRPTRAEVNDVATAVYQGTDAVMLSGEASVGKYPAGATAELALISREIEKYINLRIIEERSLYPELTDSLTKAAAEMCRNMSETIDCVVVASRTGMTPRLLGRHRIKQPIYAFVSEPKYLRRMMLSKGINRAFTYNKILSDRDKAIRELVKLSLDNRIISENNTVLFIGKTPAETGEYFPNIFEVINIKKFLSSK